MQRWSHAGFYRPTTALGTFLPASAVTSSYTAAQSAHLGTPRATKKTWHQPLPRRCGYGEKELGRNSRRIVENKNRAQNPQIEHFFLMYLDTRSNLVDNILDRITPTPDFGGSKA